MLYVMLEFHLFRLDILWKEYVVTTDGVTAGEEGRTRLF